MKRQTPTDGIETEEKSPQQPEKEQEASGTRLSEQKSKGSEQVTAIHTLLSPEGNVQRADEKTLPPKTIAKPRGNIQKPAHPRNPKQSPRKGTASEAKAAEQLPLLPEDDLLVALTKAGFEYVDNRVKANNVWVYYVPEKKEAFEKICAAHGIKARLEERGTISTNNKPAWQITRRK